MDAPTIPIMASAELIGKLDLPSDSKEAWEATKAVLSLPIEGPADLDSMITILSQDDPEPKVCSFFGSFDATVSSTPAFDLQEFMTTGLPLVLEVPLVLPLAPLRSLSPPPPPILSHPQ